MPNAALPPTAAAFAFQAQAGVKRLGRVNFVFGGEEMYDEATLDSGQRDAMKALAATNAATQILVT